MGGKKGYREREWEVEHLDCCERSLLLTILAFLCEGKAHEMLRQPLA